MRGGESAVTGGRLVMRGLGEEEGGREKGIAMRVCMYVCVCVCVCVSFLTCSHCPSSAAAELSDWPAPPPTEALGEEVGGSWAAAARGERAES